MFDENYLREISEIRKAFSDLVHMTPLEQSTSFSKITENNIFLKLENLQRTGAFKIRGAYNKMSKLTSEESAAGVITASAGNHGQAVALAANLLKIKSIIVVPEGAPIVKIEAIKKYNPIGDVIEFGSTYDAAYQKALQIQKRRKLTFIHAYDDIDVIKGQATIGLEILEQNPEIEYIFCPVGGGGLISGISSYCKHKKEEIKIIGVQSENAKSLYNSFKEKKIVRSPIEETICDGIAVKSPGKLTFNIIQAYVDEIVTVSDDEVANAMLLLLERAKTFAEGAGAASLAAVLAGKINLSEKNICCIISGGNLTPNLLDRILHKGLIKEGRLLKIQTSMPDRPGELVKLLKIIADLKANVVSVQHQRGSLELEITETNVVLELETRNADHIEDILSALKKQYRVEVLKF